MNEEHPFVQWWINKSRWHGLNEHWQNSLSCAEGNLAIEAWNAAVLEFAIDGARSTTVERLTIPKRTS